MDYHLTPHQLKKLRRELEQEKHDIELKDEQNDHYGLDESMRDETGELSQIDNHPADVATELYDRELDLSLQDHDDNTIFHINGALERMKSGTYGICQICGQPIPYERLEAVPSTAFCKDHSPKNDVSDYRPVEEEFLMPPFGRTSMDEHDDQNGFDGEDTWQIVENFGTSNSPAMAEGSDIQSYDEMEIEAYDELEGCVEPFESFVATDITGNDVTVIHNRQYERYMEQGEGVNVFESSENDD
ncbi:TraR/DksA C4-type zinc finger protein [Paenibacillus pini]|uniref:DnaK suppressor protein n=1 Tax=Paenibacillus pini JCM 16418 TaxID=1236976 RepID=W7YHQ0_9BACL|nr:TraR/DksA C4-type zinc finger protein [Paenibacillus pini]GAF07108.1 DnaK suppressor protein [Paenibacillus pini JCM 16418]